MKRLGAVLCMALLGAAGVHADVIYDNFGPGYAYDGGGGPSVIGPPSGTGGQMSAMFFTPSADYTLDSITVGIGSFQGTNSLNLALYSDASGAPGTALESWSGITMGPAFTSGVVETVTDSANVQLTSGVQYWVVAIAGADDTHAVWGDSLTATGIWEFSEDGGSSWQPVPSGPTSSVGAFSVEGTAANVPEPGTCALFALGLLGLVRRRKKA